MTPEQKTEKYKKIREAREATRLRHSTMDCKPFELKITDNKLTTFVRQHLKMIFHEARWFYNDMLASENISEYDYKKKEVIVLNKDRVPELRPITHLSSHMKQGILEQAKANLRTLSTKKKKGEKVGRLNFKSVISSISLKDFCRKDIYKTDYVRLQGLKKLLKVKGIKQIPRDAEIACAKLIKRNGDHYLRVTCFVPRVPRIKTNKHVGVDPGCETTVTTSEGQKLNVKVPKTKKLKKTQRLASKKPKRSKRRQKMFDKFNKENEKIQNKKDDKRHKLVHDLVRENDVISIQDDSFKSWQKGGHGRAVEKSCLGGITSDLKKKAETLILVDRYFPSTKTCNKCHHKGPPLDEKQRVFVCGECGHTADRDVNAAQNTDNRGLDVLEALREGRSLEEFGDIKVYRNGALWDAGTLKQSLRGGSLRESGALTWEVHRVEAMSCS